MCGINGFVSKTKTPQPSLELMNSIIFHRGPDQDGFFSDNSDSYTVGMAMRRLSIIDLSSGKQPIFTADKSKVIVFNGEIYNYQTLRDELVQSGVRFETHSDTEVILKLYEREGVASFSKLDGMFAFSIYDKTLKKVFIARDFFGEKPLYYQFTGDKFTWASELKSIVATLGQRPAIDKHGLNLFLQLTYIPAPHTIYEGIRKLEANHYLVFDCGKFNFEIHEIKQEELKFATKSKAEAVSLTRELVQKSVRSRSIADVPLGTFLSGGVDSSIVSACLAKDSEKKIETFSIGFDKKEFDETEKSREVARLIGSNHHEFTITANDLSDNIDRILLNFDEPFADSSALASYVVAQKTRGSVTVALTGDGGDEVFGGYNKYYMGKLNSRYTGLVPRSLHNTVDKILSPMLKTKSDDRGIRFKGRRLLEAINYDGSFYYNIISLGFPTSELSTALQPGWQMGDPLAEYKKMRSGKHSTLSDFREIDRLLSLEGDMLVKVDRTAMLASLECRAPFLSKELWQFTSSLPENYLLNGWDKKHILKEAFKDWFPKGFLDKSKKGFGVPVGDWLRGLLREELISYTEPAFLANQGIFNPLTIVPLVQNHIDGKADNTFRVWTYFCFQKWYTQTYAR